MAGGLPPCLFPLQEKALERLRGVKRIQGSGLLEGSQTKAALVISANPSLVLQAALTPADAGHSVVVVMGGEKWTSMPPTFHLMPRPSSKAMASIRFWYPVNLAELTQLIFNEDVVARTVIVSDADILVRRSLGGMIGGKVFLKTFARLSAILHSYLASCLGDDCASLPMANLVVFSSFSEEEEMDVVEKSSLWYQEVWKEEVKATRNQLISIPQNITFSFYLSDGSYYMQGLDL